jgi:molybdopterin converting factor small subunit
MMVEVRLFAVARQLAESEKIVVELPTGSTVADLRSAIARDFPALAPLLAHMLIAVGAEYAAEATVLHAGADVACIPPVSGG